MDALRALRDDHVTLLRLLGRAVATKPKAARRRRDLLERLDRLLAVHATVEEEVLYPTLDAAGAGDAVRTAYEEHLLCERLLDELAALPSDDRRWVGKALMLRQLLEHHLAGEEAALFPLVDLLLEAEGRAALAVRLARRRAAARAVVVRAPLRERLAARETGAANADLSARDETPERRRR